MPLSSHSFTKHYHRNHPIHLEIQLKLIVRAIHNINSFMTFHCSANHWTGFYLISVMKELRRSSTMIHQNSVLTCCKAEFTFLFFLLSGFSLKNIHDSQDSRGRGRLSLYIPPTISTRFTDTKTLAWLLQQETHLSA